MIVLDTESASIAGQIFTELELLGKTIGWADRLIAGIALQQKRVLVTGKTRHFDRVIEAGYPLQNMNWRVASG